MVIDIDTFGRINNDNLESNGFSNGSLVFVVGSGFLPEEGDEYLFRKMFIVCSVDEEEGSINTNYTYVRGESITPLPQEEQDELKGTLLDEMPN